MRNSLIISVASLGLLAWGGTVYAQIKPESSGKPSSSEPEPNPRGEGDYRPNTPGQPKVGATARSGAPSPYENQIRKDSDPSVNGK